MTKEQYIHNLVNYGITLNMIYDCYCEQPKHIPMNITTFMDAYNYWLVNFDIDHSKVKAKVKNYYNHKFNLD